MNAFLAIVLGLGLAPLLALHLFGLPANWIILACAGLFAWLRAPADMDLSFFLIAGSLALTGEIVEFAAQYHGTKRYGGTNKGNLGGIVGAFVGALLLAPLFFGLGTLIGALAGTYLGCYLFERHHGLAPQAAAVAAKGAFFGRALGLTAKCGLGATIVALAVRAAWS